MKRIRNCHVLIVTTFYQCSSKEQWDDVGDPETRTWFFRSNFRGNEFVTEQRERELIAHITALLFSTVMNNVLCLKVQQKILGKSIAKNGFIICPTGFPSARFSSGSTFFQPFFHFTKVDSV